ncbi:MAG: NAD(+) kinase [Acidiferrobacteraceae bacterium]
MSAAIHTSTRTIGLFGKYGDERFAPTMRNLCDFLQKRGLEIILESATAEVVDIPHSDPASDVRILPLGKIGAEIDLAIVIGGDGTLLNVARALAAHHVPLVGVNVGRLGFLADISKDDMIKVIGRILDGNCQIEERFMLYAEIIRDGRVVHASHAFNDVVVNKLGLARLIEIETHIDGQLVNRTRADGIIVATPTGSTAYAMSAGGPILHPTLPAIVVVPICPHTLSHRPIAINSSSRVELVMSGDQSAHVTFDGQANYALQDDDRIVVRRADNTVTLIHPSNRNHYYEMLRVKLHWGRP